MSCCVHPHGHQFLSSSQWSVIWNCGDCVILGKYWEWFLLDVKDWNLHVKLPGVQYSFTACFLRRTNLNQNFELEMTLLILRLFVTVCEKMTTRLFCLSDYAKMTVVTSGLLLACVCSSTGDNFGSCFLFNSWLYLCLWVECSSLYHPFSHKSGRWWWMHWPFRTGKPLFCSSFFGMLIWD